MKKNLLVLVGLWMAILSQSAVKVHTIGDSTMADYDPSTTDKRGWCTYLGSFFDPEWVTVNNRGKSGASSRTFYTGAAYWQSVKSQMSAGDYVLIQFAHNDENNSGLDVLEYNAYLAANGQDTLTDLRGTHPQTSYKDYLRKYVNETRALNCHPVLVAPICRKYFSGNTIRRNGQHDLGDNFSKLENGQLLTAQKLPTTDHTMDYVESMRAVANELEVPFIDLTSATRDLYLQYGETQCTQYLFCQGDNTHTATLGANLIARLAAQLLKDANILSQYIQIPTSISCNPSSLDFGDCYKGQTLRKELLLTGFNLTPEAGSVNLSTSGKALLSTDATSFASNATCTYAAGTLFQNVQVEMTLSEEGQVKDTIVITAGTTTLQIPLVANVLQMADGMPFKVVWVLSDSGEPVVTGAISATDQTLTNLEVKQYGTVGSTKLQLLQPDGGTWPGGEIDEVANRFADFAIQVPEGMRCRITHICLGVMGKGGNNTSVHVNIGNGDAFANPQTIFEKVKMVKDSLYQVEHVALITLEAGESFHVRALPWQNTGSESTGKYLGLSNVTIEGVLENPEASDLPLAETQRARKMLLNGQLLIIAPDGAVYDALGRR